jgi:cytoskeletal protein CcmA (bactofilin family)
MATSASGEFAHIGKSVSIKGEVSGSEDLYVDNLRAALSWTGTVSPSAQTGECTRMLWRKCDGWGQLDGNILASERTEMRKSAVVNGDVQTRRIAIEEGAYFKGRLEILPDKKVQNAPEATAVAASSTASAALHA